MSGKVNIPSESWRPARRAATPLDPQMLRIGVLAAAVLGAAGLGAGGYALLGHRPHAVPVVEADSRPLRIRPDNPGGNTVEGAEEQVMGGGQGRVDAMAPPAEAPMPQALRAQIEAARTPPPAQPVSLATPPAPAPAPVSDIPDRPASVPRMPHPPVTARPAPPLPPPPVTPGGTAQVQLGALDSEQAAAAEWQRLAHRMPDLLGARRPAVLRAERDGKTLWRLRTGGFADAAAATAFCAQVRAKGTVCAVASF